MEIERNERKRINTVQKNKQRRSEGRKMGTERLNKIQIDNKR